MKADVYERITGQIVTELEKGVRPWFKPWNAEHAAGRITRPLRSNGIPYRGINVLMLWSEAMTKGFAAPIWMTFKQALELDAHVKKGEKGSLVVYASKVTRTETDGDSGEETERDIPFMKGYTVFNVEQVEGLPAQYYAKAEPRLDTVPADRPRRIILRRHGCQPSSTAAIRLSTRWRKTGCRCRRSRLSGTPKAITPRWPMK